jgi:signal transduction histidine kinase
MLMGGLLVLVILAISVAAYVEVRNTALTTAGERVSTIALQLRDNFQQSGAQLRADLGTAAAAPALAAYIASPTPASRAAALQAMAASGPSVNQVLGTELRDRAGRVLLSTIPAGFAFDTMSLANARESATRDTVSIGRFRAVASMPDTLVFPTVARVGNDGGAWLVRWRRLSGSRRQRELISQLIGSNASLFLGNTDGRVGTDLERAATRPTLPVDTPGATRVYQRDPDRTEYLAASAVVAGTPWVVIVDMPMADIQAPIHRFVGRISLIAAVALLIGLAAAWITSRRITRPIVQLTDAATAIAAGDFSRDVRIDRADELGQLGEAFGTMAAEVRQTRHTLEHRIAERTRDLESTVTQLNEAQEALVRRERLAMLGQLSSGVGHELRNPLGVMTNAVYYLKAVLGSAPANVLEYLDILQQQITLSEKIVGDLLDFARQKPPRRSPTPLREITHGQVAKLGRNDGVDIDIQIPEDVPPVLVDPVQLGQVVLNLLTNASQAMHGHGRITVRARENGTRVFYEISDTGPGIPPQNLEKIFEPLFTTKARGIGLGLSVSRMLARANGGELMAASTPGQGATFTLWLQKAGRTA